MVLAQDTKVVRDLNLWTGAEVEKSVFDHWMVSFKQEVRLKKNATEFSSTFSQLGVDYEISRNFSLAGKYRFILNSKSDKELNKQSRYTVDLNYKGRLQHISIYYRIRYQKEVENMRLLSIDEPCDRFIRNKISIRYTDLKRIKPYLSAEIFQLHEAGEFLNNDKFRVVSGIKISPKSFGTFNVSYGVEHEINEILPYTYFICKINYKYEF